MIPIPTDPHERALLELAVLEYVGQHPGCTREAIERHVAGLGFRVTMRGYYDTRSDGPTA